MTLNYYAHAISDSALAEMDRFDCVAVIRGFTTLLY